MTHDEMRARSAEKVKQASDLLKLLNLRVEAKERITQDGFIEKVVFWIDDEKYPADEPVPVGTQTEATPEAPAPIADPHVPTT